MTTATAPKRGLELSREVRSHFDPAVVKTACGLLPSVANQNWPLVQKYFELAAKLDLNPLTGEIWLASMRGRNAGPGDLVVLVGRDGYMKVARRHADFVTCFGQPVYTNDEFEVEVDDDGGYAVRHKLAHPKDRGDLTGAYARLFRVGKPRLYFFASLTQYGKTAGRTTDSGREVKTPWSYTDSMLIKSAASYLLRTTYSISGPVPHDEVAVGLDADGAVGGPSEHSGPDLPGNLQDLYERVRSSDPDAFSEGELRARAMGAPPEALAEIEQELEAWLSEHEPADADVVEDVIVGQSEEPGPVERWEAMDEQQRGRVLVLVNRRLDLEGALSEAGLDHAGDIHAELDAIEAELASEHGITSGWTPPSGADPESPAAL